MSDSSPTHPCAKIVLSQWDGHPAEERVRHWRDLHQLPEPWQGHLESARILFVSSNPSIRGSISTPYVLPQPPDDGRVVAGETSRDHPSVRRRDGPKWEWTDSELVDRYESSFDLYIVGGTRDRRPDGSVARATMFWSAVKRRAQELIPHRPVRPGIDYALTEVVRCKSRSERGVAEALDTCSSLYLRETLEITSANVIVVLGRWARIAVERCIGLRPKSVVTGPVTIGDRDRWVAFLPHPNARAVRSFPGLCTAEELQRLQNAARG